MRRTMLLVAGWFLAGAVAVTAASVGVRMVGRQVTGERPAPLSATEVRQELDQEAATTTSAPSATTDTTTPVDDPTPSSTTVTTATTAPSVVPPPTTAAPPASETRTYTLIGGTATLRFSPAGVTVVAATPNTGFSVKTEPEHGNGVQVRFESDRHRSRVDGWWEGGPQDRIREEPD